MDEKITSRENAKIKYACRLSSSAAFRRSEGRFLAEGRKLCPELARGAQLETLFYTEDAMARCPELADLPGEHYLVEDHVADKLADVGTHQGVFGVFRTPVHTLDEVRTGGRYLALERVQDPGNVGTLLRSAAAFGFDGVILSEGCAGVYAPKTLRASMGAAVRIPVIETGAMQQVIALLREKGITCLAAALYQSQPLSAAKAGYPGGVCVVIGSEGQGLTDAAIAAWVAENLPEAEVVAFEDGIDALMELNSERAQAAIVDEPRFRRYVQVKEPHLQAVELVASDKDYAFAVAAGNEALLTAVNEALTALRADGSYDALYDSWFGDAGIANEAAASREKGTGNAPEAVQDSTGA